jgi:hypothetical protein
LAVPKENEMEGVESEFEFEFEIGIGIEEVGRQFRPGVPRMVP